MKRMTFILMKKWKMKLAKSWAHRARIRLIKMMMIIKKEQKNKK